MKEQEQTGQQWPDEMSPGAENEEIVAADVDEALQTEAVEAELLEQLQKALAEREEYLDLAQRVQADFENFKRRNQGVRLEAFEDGKREVITAILPVMDNLERALESAADQDGPLQAGVAQVAKQLRDLLIKMGVEEIDCLGKPFDPEEANAVMQVPAAGKEPGTVSEVLLKGYRMGSRVLRYAMVTVAA